MNDLSELIPALQGGDDGPETDVASWIAEVGDFQKAIGYTAVFWPEFVEIDGCIVRAGVTQEQIRGWLDYCEGDRSGAEGILNQLHVENLHRAGCPDVTRERLAYLGGVLKQMCECKLKRDFPDKTFTVEYVEAESDDLSDFIVTFYQSTRPDNAGE